ncbi:MAG: phosphoribosylformylglycinamidine cyclo-ligase [Actinomycetota bacterium]|nr:phosphoribosylformylglycinamidine cyclo-ligase [Actinomycetota bacterium]
MAEPTYPGAAAGVAALVDVLQRIDTGRPSRAVMGSGHYANVLRLDERRGLALSTDGVGTKLLVAEQLGRFDTVGIDCVAMNVNDVVCVGAEPIALLDYIAVAKADPDVLGAVAEGLRRGAEDAGVEIPGGELAVVPEMVDGLDLVGACVGTVELSEIVTGSTIQPGDALIGLPASGVHSNGLTLARRALPDLSERPPELSGASVGETLLEPTVIYVRAVMALLRSGVDVRGLAHVTGDGLLNLLRLETDVGYRVTSPLPRPPVFDLIAARGSVFEAEMNEVFNMGCGFVCVVGPTTAGAGDTVDLLAEFHPGAAVIGEVTDRAGVVEVAGLTGRRGEGFAAAT